MCLWAYANSKYPSQPAKPRSLLFSVLGNSFSRRQTVFFSDFSRKYRLWSIDFQANRRFGKRFARIVKVYFLGKTSKSINSLSSAESAHTMAYVNKDLCCTSVYFAADNDSVSGQQRPWHNWFEPVLFACVLYHYDTYLFKYTENFATKKWKFSDKTFWYLFIFLLET